MSDLRTDNPTNVKIAALNDKYRKEGRWLITKGAGALEDFTGLCNAIHNYKDFDESNDPYGEHDFGSLVWHGQKVFWKIDYYGRDLKEWADPSSPECSRVLTVMLAEEY